MKFSKSKYNYLWIALSAVILLGSCEDEYPSLPNESETIIAKLRADDRFSRFVEALDTTSISSTLSGRGPLTVFAVTNEGMENFFAEINAIQPLPNANKDTVDRINLIIGIFDSGNRNAGRGRKRVSDLINYHIVRNEFTSGNLPELIFTSLNPQSNDGIDPTIGVYYDQGNKRYEIATDSIATNTLSISGSMINQSANIIEPDILASNGVIHVIDRVLLPPLKE